jgi:hypothetical protein
MLEWLLPYYERVCDFEYDHIWIPHWYSGPGMWGCDTVDILRRRSVQIPLFVMD